MAKTTQTDEIHAQKVQYHRIMQRSLAKTPAEFNAAVASLLPNSADADPKDWVRAAAHAMFRCGRCAGTGAFITGTVNGKPTGPGGICFRCEGKGVQDDADRRRNYGYDNHAAAHAA